jgi:hypothetical protein
LLRCFDSAGNAALVSDVHLDNERFAALIAYALGGCFELVETPAGYHNRRPVTRQNLCKMPAYARAASGDERRVAGEIEHNLLPLSDCINLTPTVRPAAKSCRT